MPQEEQSKARERMQKARKKACLRNMGVPPVAYSVSRAKIRMFLPGKRDYSQNFIDFIMK
jgi:hypothetical protein